MKESFVKNRVIEWLGRKGWVILGVKGNREHGVDVKARKGGAYFYIEAKGDPGSLANRRNYLFNCFGEIAKNMQGQRIYRYGMAFPEGYRSLIKRCIPWQVWYALKLEALLVNENGGVERLNWQNFKRIRERR